MQTSQVINILNTYCKTVTKFVMMSEMIGYRTFYRLFNNQTHICEIAFLLVPVLFALSPYKGYMYIINQSTVLETSESTTWYPRGIHTC